MRLRTKCKVEPKMLIEQIDEFNPEAVCIESAADAEKLEKHLSGKNIKVFCGSEGLIKSPHWILQTPL